jgi:hypothetical protein
MKITNTFKLVCIALLISFPFGLGVLAQDKSGVRSALELYDELENYASQQRAMLASKGKRYDAAARDEIAGDKKALAKKYAAEVAARTDIKDNEFYYLGRLYSVAENEQKTLDSMKNFLAQYPPGTKGNLIQSALGFVIVLSSQMKKMPAAEQAYEQWLKGEPFIITQQPALEDHLARGYLKDGQYEHAIRHAQSAFNLLKTLAAKTMREKKDREQVYINLVEVLALGYRIPIRL